MRSRWFPNVGERRQGQERGQRAQGQCPSHQALSISKRGAATAQPCRAAWRRAGLRPQAHAQQVPRIGPRPAVRPPPGRRCCCAAAKCVGLVAWRHFPRCHVARARSMRVASMHWLRGCPRVQGRGSVLACLLADKRTFSGWSALMLWFGVLPCRAAPRNPLPRCVRAPVVWCCCRVVLNGITHNTFLPACGYRRRCRWTVLLGGGEGGGVAFRIRLRIVVAVALVWRRLHWAAAGM